MTSFMIVFSCLLLQTSEVLAELGRGYFIVTPAHYDEICEDPDVIVVASTGRSGSTLLFMTLANFVKGKRMLKTHCLPPKASFRGKILFIFSNPDLAAESALYQSLRHRQFGDEHFINLETADQDWLLAINNCTLHQTLEHNLLGYDAFGCAKHLESWLHLDTLPSPLQEAQVMAIKYENLWEPATMQAIKDFLCLDALQFPLKRKRGRKFQALSEIEKLMKLKYNRGTEEIPQYTAYDDARTLWKIAPPYQFLKITKP